MNADFLNYIKEKLDIKLLHKTPCILQTESAECGLACLAMVISFFGSKVDLSSLRQTHGSSAQGVTLGKMIEIAKEESLNARALSLDINELSELKLPCVLHWDFNHFVVLTRIQKSYVVIHDPATGRRKISFKELSQHFTGVALEFWPRTDFVKKERSERISILSLLSSVKGIWKFIGRIAFLSIIIEAISLLIPAGTQMVMDHVLIAKDHDLLTVICLSLLAMTVLKMLVGTFRGWNLLVAGTLVNVQWRFGLFNHLINLPVAYFEKRQVGQVQSRFNSIDELQRSFTDNIVQLFIDTIVVIGLLTMMFFYGKWLVIIALGFTLIYITFRVVTYNFYRQAVEENLVKEAKANSHFMESLYGINTIKALDLAEQRTQTWFNQTIDAVNAFIRVSRFNLIFSGINGFVMIIEQIAILYFGASAVLDQAITIGMYIAFSEYRGQFSERISAAINSLLQMRMMGLHSERIADIANENSEARTKNTVLDHGVQSVDLKLKDISFQYDQHTPFIFENLSLEVQPGESVAIVGPSGMGKTTLIKIMSGLMQPTSGELLVNGLPLSKIGLNHYRKISASVLQEDKLFAGSIHDNIAAFRDDVSRELVIESAIRANIHNDIMAMPMGYETFLGELGGTLSGGQRQRLMIARALCKLPRIVFFDEATSHLDVENEKAINDSIRSLSITRIIIAHRRSTIESADRIIDITALSRRQAQ